MLGALRSARHRQYVDKRAAVQGFTQARRRHDREPATPTVRWVPRTSPVRVTPRATAPWGERFPPAVRLTLEGAPAERIERFLRDNPSGTLRSTVGFASALGVASLNERTAGRQVRLLIDDTRTGFANYSDADRRAAVLFIRRPDVSVRNWYRKRGGYRTAHAKTWIVEPAPPAGVSGPG